MKQLQGNVMQTVAEKTVGLPFFTLCVRVCVKFVLPVSLSVTAQNEENRVPSNSFFLPMLDIQTDTKREREGANERASKRL